MKRFVAAAVVIVACGACGGRQPASPRVPLPADVAPTGAACDAAVGVMFGRAIDAGHKDVDAIEASGDEAAVARHVTESLLASMMPKLEAATANACAHDAWPADMLACISGPDGGYEDCAIRLTPTQKANADAAMEQAIASTKL